MSKELSRNERIKEASEYLRGTLAEGLRDEVTGAIIEDDAQLVKFHGMYLQDDRDLRGERSGKKMEKAFAFMLRVRISGGVLTSPQYLALDKVARDYGNHTMRITTRQTIQLHGVIKSNLKATLRTIDAVALSTIAACGDVNRNVICNPNPHQSKVHRAAYELAVADSMRRQRKRKRPIRGGVYLVKDGADRVKVGITQNIAQRLSDLRNGTAEKLGLSPEYVLPAF